MSGRMTTVTLPGVGGFQEYGRQSVPDMIATYRRCAEHQLREARAVLASPDEAFRVYTHTGVHVERNIEVLQEPWPRWKETTNPSMVSGADLRVILDEHGAKQ